MKAEINRLKEELISLSKEFYQFKTDSEAKLKEKDSTIENLQNRLAENETRLESFKRQYASERYTMKLDMRTNLYKALPEEKYADELKNWYLLATGKVLSLDEPKTYNEKIQWLKLYDDNPLKTRLADKYLVKEWVKEKIGEQYLVPLLGVWETFDEIDFSKLPDKFVLKANHGCGYNIIVKDKTKLNIKEAKEKFDRWMTTNFAFVNLEMHYKRIKPMIIAEKYLENGQEELHDYQVWCFNGEPKYVMCIVNSQRDHKTIFYDTEWNRMPFTTSSNVCEKDIPKPENLDELLELAKKLSEDFKHVRVDFYRLYDGSFKFGEMTFTSGAGKSAWHPEEYDRILGDMLDIN